MSLALQVRVATLEAEVKQLHETVAGLLAVITQSEDSAVLGSAPMTEFVSAPSAAPRNPNGPRQMCPKCGEKPNYFLHVKTCKGRKGAAAGSAGSGAPI